MTTRPSLVTRDWRSQAYSQPCTLAPKNTKTDERTSHTVKTEKEGEEECSRDELIKINLQQHLIYISHCIKPDDLILHLHCFSKEQKSDIQAEKNLIHASRKALQMLLHDVEEPGRFVELREALLKNDGYPKIVRILDGEYDPEDQKYVKVVELFTPEIIDRLEPAELLPFLLQKGVFKQMDVEEIRAEQTIHGKMRAACVLLMYLPRRTVDWFRCFLQALIDCKLGDIVEMLDPDIFKDLYSKTNKQTDVVSCSSSTSQPSKPKIAPKPKIRVPSCKANTHFSKQSKPKIVCPENMEIYAVCKMACGRRIIVLKGSLVDIRVDVMVNPTDHHLSLKQGLAGTISKKGGENIRKECRSYIQSVRRIDEGDVFVSEAGDLPADYVIHVNSPTWLGGNKGEDTLLKQAVMKIMLQASLRKARTIAMPAISCGISGFPKKTGAGLIIRALKNFFSEDPDSSLQHVYIVDIHEMVAERLTDALSTVLKDDPKYFVEKVKEY